MNVFSILITCQLFVVTKMSCDFDTGTFCQWNIDGIARLKWQIYDPQKPKIGLPKFDHTKGNSLGRYAYVLGDDVSEKLANITSPAVDKDWGGKFCFSFWYIMDVEGPNSLTVYAEHASSFYARAQYVPFWSRQGNYGYRWRHAYAYINSIKPTPKVRVTGSVRTGVIAVDDFEARGGECPPTKICTFDGEEDMCGFTQDSRNTQDWDAVKGEDDAVMYKFPDHTMQSAEGSFLYIGFNGSTDIRHRARIYSTKRQPSATPSCVTFYYHIYNVSQLSLDTYIATSGGLSDPQWTAFINQGLLWHGARFEAVSKTVSWQIMFEVSTEKYGYGQVAIDDVLVESGKCPDPGYCDFEQENCLWEDVRPPYKLKIKPISGVMSADVTKDLLTDDFDWKRHIGYDYFGPPEDHTLGSTQGFYSILDPRNKKEGQKAVMVSERLMFPGGVCLKLWYATPNYKNGASLQVFTSSDFKTADQIKLIKDITNEEWKQALITIVPTPNMDRMFSDFWVG